MQHFTLPLPANAARTELTARIEEAMQSFCALSDVAITFFDPAGEIKREWRPQSKFCDYFFAYHDPESACMKNLASSAKLAAELGEPYVFLCKAGLVKIAVALILEGQTLGCFMAGPLVMGELKERDVSSLFSADHLRPDMLPKAILFLRTIKTYNPKEIAHLSSLLWNSILAAVAPSADYVGINSRFKEQNQVSLSLQKYKKENKTTRYPYDLENQLFALVKEGEAQKALETLGDLMEKISLSEAGDLSAIKTKALGICTILTRSVTDKTILTQEQAESYYFNMNALNKATSFQDLSALTSGFVKKLAEAVASTSYAGNSQIIRLAVQYVNEHYKDKISLRTVAGHLHTNPSYLSMLFKQEMGVTFTHYLNQMRINRSCDLLTSTNLNLVDVSFQVGYDDQSYYTKIFKKLKGTTPKNYRTETAGK